MYEKIVTIAVQYLFESAACAKEGLLQKQACAPSAGCCVTATDLFFSLLFLFATIQHAIESITRTI